MRVLTRQIWRAFPELDRFSDDQCARFVRAARRGVLASIAQTLACAVVASLCLAAVGGLVWLLPAHLWNTSSGFMAVASAATVIAFLSASLSALLVRDMMLRQRLRWVIKAKGTCGNCSYGLLGLPVPDDLRITCPECGMDMWVDAALTELVTDEKGQRRLKPKPERRVLPRWMNRRLGRNVGKAAALLVLVTVIGGAGWWTWREHQLAQQAKLAKADLQGWKFIQELNESFYPPLDKDMSENEALAKDGWTLFDKVLESLTQANSDVASAPDALLDAQGTAVLPETSYISDVTWKDGTEKEAKYEAQAEMARRALRRFAEINGDERLLAMVNADRAVRDWRKLESPSAPMVNLLLTWLGEARKLAGACAAKMELALEAGDAEAYMLALKAGLKVSTMVEREPLLMNRLVGLAIESLMMNQVRRHLVTGSNDGNTLATEWLAPIEDAFAARQRGVAVTFTDTMKGERYLARQTLAWMFSDPDRVRTVAAADQAAYGGFSSRSFDLTSRVGSYEENCQAVDAMFSMKHFQIGVPFAQRPKPASPERSPLVLMESLIRHYGNAIRADYLRFAQRIGLETMLAIERFRAEHGRYPNSLSELIPDRLAELPVDPFSGATLRYKLIDASTDPHRRGYLLYAVGVDGVDDGGKQSDRPAPQAVFWDESLTGLDFIYNTPN